ncbi:TetR/AcrR family transcriptional regulator [Streptomyces tauricus]|uniref:TetR/AcrR family transcriptional regulator n=1 Tax=Streptomyces tauricus TaxID=68274 RepID=UPI0034303DB9
MTGRPLRRDAERNRQRLLETARELMARDGLRVPYEEIARAAGSGMGTLYRRFPDRQDLVDALFAEHVDAVVALAQQACRSDDPWSGLTWFMERQFELEAGNRALGELLRGDQQGTARLAQGCARIAELAAQLIERAVGAGQLPPGVTSGDLEAVHLMVGAVMDASRQQDPDRWRRALAVALAGLRHADLQPDGEPIRSA